MYIIDRIEEGIAVVFDEKGNKTEVNISEIEGDPTDGTVILKNDKKWLVDDYETMKRKNRAKNRLKGLFSNKG